MFFDVSVHPVKENEFSVLHVTYFAFPACLFRCRESCETSCVSEDLLDVDCPWLKRLQRRRRGRIKIGQKLLWCAIMVPCFPQEACCLDKHLGRRNPFGHIQYQMYYSMKWTAISKGVHVPYKTHMTISDSFSCKLDVKYAMDWGEGYIIATVNKKTMYLQDHTFTSVDCAG